MRGKPGLICQIIGGGKALAYHSDQRKEFKELNKHFIHYLNDDFTPMLDEKGNPKTGLKASDKLKLIGYSD